ncbi:MAG TPA: TatD family deoxyribonuclease [Candidatus Marinimicrobia bacterium]|nr:TatD family deoxyribonuclease [Candidatus Neomarinimicrobiota bacterium]HIO74287.1 TatD family deoxyribonuclease [Candidatus Neomarinimicrobiota bacterium]HIO88855.1 TatD family deoxyribonuclease [Candidatus Neomarinimicrobiota bacterium]
MYIDTHAHLYYDNLKNQLAKVVERAEAAGVTQIICVGTDLPSSETSISIAEKYDAVFATVGVHPHDAKDAPDDYLHQLRDLTSHSKVVAVGEMGLDYFRDFSPRNVQKEVFQSQLALARELDLPAVIHNRDADEDILKILEEVRYEKSVLHCFSSNTEMAGRAISLGCLLSFTGNVTFGKNHTESVLLTTPLNRIMLETDCPFMTPVPNRGKLNEPANILHIAQWIAKIKRIDVSEVAESTTSTAQFFYNLPV